jgi:hypothetical protein
MIFGGYMEPATTQVWAEVLTDRKFANAITSAPTPAPANPFFRRFFGEPFKPVGPEGTVEMDAERAYVGKHIRQRSRGLHLELIQINADWWNPYYLRHFCQFGLVNFDHGLLASLIGGVHAGRRDLVQFAPFAQPQCPYPGSETVPNTRSGYSLETRREASESTLQSRGACATHLRYLGKDLVDDERFA